VRSLIHASDTDFSKLRVWRDLDSDGNSDVNELYTLDELGINSIKLNYVNVSNQSIEGNDIRQTAYYVRNDYTERKIVDAWFASDQLDSRYNYRSTYNTPFVLTQEILALPNLRGYGNLPDLHIAMAKDAQLLVLVKDFTQKASLGGISDAGALVQSILFRWAGVDAVIPESRGVNVNAQELGFVEKFLGRYFLNAPNSQPFAGQASLLNPIYPQLAASLAVRLIAQLVEIPVTYDPVTDLLTFAGDVTAAQTQLEQILTQLATSSSEQLELNAIVLAQFLSEQGTQLTDLLVGSLLSNTLIGKVTNERIYGLIGDDTLDGSSGNDTIMGGTGYDVLKGSNGNDYLNGGINGDNLDGGYDQDTLIGGDGGDFLNGGDGTDYLDGGAGNDALVGGHASKLPYGGWYKHYHQEQSIVVAQQTKHEQH
jgi:hypothetical protein